MCGTETVTRQQKNTSFGANTFRDGVSYNEQQQKKALVEIDDLASLSIGECYALLPEPTVRVARLQTPEAKIYTKHPGFIARLENTQSEQQQFYDDPEILIELDDVNTEDSKSENSSNNQSPAEEKNNSAIDEPEFGIQ